jgi:hypothetical protein
MWLFIYCYTQYAWDWEKATSWVLQLYAHFSFFFPIHVKPSIFNSLFLFLVNFHYYWSLNTRFGSSNFVARKDHCLSNTMDHQIHLTFHIKPCLRILYYKTIVWNDDKSCCFPIFSLTPPHPSKPAIPPPSSPTSTFISVPTIAT